MTLMWLWQFMVDVVSVVKALMVVMYCGLRSHVYHMMVFLDWRVVVVFNKGRVFQLTKLDKAK